MSCPSQPCFSFTSLHRPFCWKPSAASCHSPCCSWHVVYLMARSARCCTRLLCVCFQSELPTACLVRHKAVFLKTALWRYNCYTTNCPCFGCNFGCVSMPMKTWPRSRQQDRHLPESLMSLHSLSLLFHPQTTPDVFSVLYISLHFLAFAGVKQRCSVFHPGFFYSTQLLCNPSRSRVWVVLSFLLASSIPLYEYTPICLSTHLLMGLDYFQFGAMNTYVQVFIWT